MKENRCKFWMCMVDGTTNPRYVHWTEGEARLEAERLARQTGSDVFLLEAVDFVRVTKPQPPTEWKPTKTIRPW